MTTQAEHFAELVKLIKQVDQKLTRKVDQSNRKVDAAVEQIEAMRGDVNKTKDIVEAWNAVKTGGKFIRWAVPIIAAAAGSWAAMKAGLWSLLK